MVTSLDESPMLSLPVRRPVLAAALAALAACGGDGTAPGRVASSIEVDGAPASAPAGLALAESPRFVVRDQRGSPMAGVAVTVTVVSGGGSLASAPTQTSPTGFTSIGTWTLGTTTGPNTVSIAAAGLAPRIIAVQGAPGAPATVTLLSGGGQSALAGQPLAQPLVFVVRDRFDNPVPQQTVTVTGDLGGASTGPAAVTGADGSASVAGWTLGRYAGAHTIRASAGEATGTATATARTDFRIDVRFFGGTTTEAQRALFTRAAARIGAFITGDVESASAFGIDLGEFCGIGAGTLNEEIDDVIIYASIQPIDGAGKTLAQAGPCGVRDDEAALPAIGVMEFDSADLGRLTNGGSLEDVIVHEMMHVLGLGSSYWRLNGILLGFDTPAVAYQGQAGVLGCRAHGGASVCQATVPVENTGGGGTANSHWRETTFDNELMTGFINAGSNPISRLTIGQFGDIGYTGLNYEAADEYRLPGSLLRAPSAVSAETPVGEEWERGLSARVVRLARGRGKDVRHD